MSQTAMYTNIAVETTWIFYHTTVTTLRQSFDFFCKRDDVWSETGSLLQQTISRAQTSRLITKMRRPRAIYTRRYIRASLESVTDMEYEKKVIIMTIKTSGQSV